MTVNVVYSTLATTAVPGTWMPGARWNMGADKSLKAQVGRAGSNTQHKEASTAVSDSEAHHVQPLTRQVRTTRVQAT